MSEQEPPEGAAQKKPVRKLRPKREESEYPRLHLYLDAEDVQWYRDTFGETLGLSKAIRTVMRSYRRSIEAQAAPRAQRVNQITPDLMAEIEKIAAEEPPIEEPADE